MLQTTMDKLLKKASSYEVLTLGDYTILVYVVKGEISFSTLDQQGKELSYMEVASIFSLGSINVIKQALIRLIEKEDGSFSFYPSCERRKKIYVYYIKKMGLKVEEVDEECFVSKCE